MSNVVATPSSLVPVPDRRGSWLPTWSMITSRFMELRRRRGLMVALVVVNIGIPVIFLTIRLIAHALAPKSYGPAGGFSVYDALVAGVMYIFGFIVAATLGCTAGSVDLTEGVFRHLVVTGRSRLALYLARIPAGLAIVLPMVAVGFTVVCAVCCFAAPTRLDYNGVHVAPGMSLTTFQNWAANHDGVVDCNFGFRGGPQNFVPNVSCTNTRGVSHLIPASQLPPGASVPTTAQLRHFARQIATQNYADYHRQFLQPSISLMVKSGLWLELEALVGFIVGLGLASLMGQRTVPVILMIVYELILTPLLAIHLIPHFLNVQRGLVGLAVAHLEPSGLPQVFTGGGGGGPGGGPLLLPETQMVAVIVIVAWLVGWTALGAWRMVRRDA